MQESIRYDALLLPEREPFSNYSFQDSDELNPNNKIAELSLVNVFIGINNSGKSRLLRALFSLKHDEILYNTNRYSATDYFDLVESLDEQIKQNITSLQYLQGKVKVPGFEDILNNKNNFLSFNNINYQVIKDKLWILRNCQEEIRKKERDIGTFDQNILSNLTELGQQYLERLEAISIVPNLGNEKQYYIPILRGMRPLDEEQTDFYKRKTQGDYFQFNTKFESDTKHIFTGLELYQDLKQKLLGDPEDRDLVKSFEDFLSQKFFNSERVTLVPKEKGNEPKVVNIKIGNEPQFPIYQLGDGLQNLIICIFKIFTEKERCLFFIEEPDMFMHPSFQRAFLEVLCEHDQHQYFITSHSNHFLDMTLDFENISVFHFSKEKEVVEGKPNFKVRTTSTRDHRLLFDLGVKNSSVFLSNSTIWVEGIADRFYLRAYMKKYIEELKDDNPNKKIFSSFREDYHYSFVEYQGTNLTHWSFEQNDENSDNILATSICGNVFLIADGDISNKGKGDREDIYQQMLGDRFYKLPAKEIENLIPEKILQNLPIVIKNFITNNVSVENIKDEDYANDQQKGIGEYLDLLLEKSIFATKPDPTKSTAGTGTLTPYYKKKFYEETKKLIDDSTVEWSLTPKLIELCQKIFEHIKEHNPR
jgi:AAA15 family ATPase/GTPase